MMFVKESSIQRGVQGIIAILALLAVIGCTRSEKNPDVTAMREDFETRTGISAGELEVLQDGVLLELGGASMQLRDKTKDAFTLVSFGASWCPHCQKEFPTLHSLHQTMEDEALFEVLTVFVKEDAATVEDYMSQAHLQFPAALDPEGIVAKANGVEGYPTTYLIDPEGNVIARHAGALDWSTRTIVNAVDALIAQWQDL